MAGPAVWTYLGAVFPEAKAELGGGRRNLQDFLSPNFPLAKGSHRHTQHPGAGEYRDPSLLVRGASKSLAKGVDTGRGEGWQPKM